jgi:hypothetical protein
MMSTVQGGALPQCLSLLRETCTCSFVIDVVNGLVMTGGDLWLIASNYSKVRCSCSQHKMLRISAPFSLYQYQCTSHSPHLFRSTHYLLFSSSDENPCLNWTTSFAEEVLLKTCGVTRRILPFQEGSHISVQHYCRCILTGTKTVKSPCSVDWTTDR